MGNTASRPASPSTNISNGQKAPGDITQWPNWYSSSVVYAKGANRQAIATSAAKPPTVACHICWKDAGEVDIPANVRVTTQCTKIRSICVDCLQQHIALHIVERQVYDSIPCICTGKLCSATLHHEEIQTYADKATFDTYNEAMSRRLIENDPEYCKCANAGCSSGQFILDRKQNQPVRCRECHVQTCVMHRSLWHQGRTCDEFDRDANARVWKLWDKIFPGQMNNEGISRRNRAAIDLLTPPVYWTEYGTKQVELHEGMPEYTKVSDFFSSALHAMRDKVEIVMITRLQNLPVWEAYALKNDTMKRRDADNMAAYRVNNRDMSAEAHERRWLFHGSPPQVIPKIAKHGFNRSYAGRTTYGHGVYFARDASYSIPYSRPDASGVQYMFMCRVAVGDWSTGRPDIKTPNSKPDNELFDSTVDNIHDPSIFVIYQDAQAYPEYLVAFKSTLT
jgi:Poly(ADP-ribose) polymerase catalytic domain/IBR domain, a half RING-finger domain